MAILLRLSQRAHRNVVLLQPTRDCVGIAPAVYFVSVNARDLNGAQFFAHILLIKPFAILIESFATQGLAHEYTSAQTARSLYIYCAVQALIPQGSTVTILKANWEAKSVMRQIPQVDKLLRHPRLSALQDRFRRDLLTLLVREELGRRRDEGGEIPGVDALADSVAERAELLLKPGMRRVINGTGIVLHTNLGRAPLTESALGRLKEISGYSNLEFDLVSGERGKRSEHVSALLRLITGAEAAICVNNNAAAVVLCVNTLARDREVIVSRGELIEIGGSFRLPEVITAGGARLREVGTTNRTRATDYERAVREETGLIVRCHRSNFQISGFTEQPNLEGVVQIGKKKRVPVLEDLGSGVLLNRQALREFPDLQKEPSVSEVVATGCDIVSFSGDKLLGGPQAGIIVGRKKIVDKLAKNPLYRALRLDKVGLALLETTLIAYLTPHPEKLLPALSMLKESADSVRSRAESFLSNLQRRIAINQSADGAPLSIAVVKTESVAGGGSLPGQHALSYGLQLKLSTCKAAQLSLKLRQAEPPVISVIKDGAVVLDFRTIRESDCKDLIEVLLTVVKEPLVAQEIVPPKIKRI